MTDREKTTELFLVAQGYDHASILKAISALSGNGGDTAAPVSPTLTPKELCGLLKISTTTLWRLKPPYILVGSRKRFQLDEVKEFLEQHQKKTEKIPSPTRKTA